ILCCNPGVEDPTQYIAPPMQLDGLKLCPANPASELSRCGLGLVLKQRARMPLPLKEVHLVIAETLVVARVVRKPQPIRDDSRRVLPLLLVFVGAQPVRRFSGPSLRSRCTNPWRRSRAPLPDAHISR